jgi:uncharacterized protein YndB with AHSA1/START domain
MKITVTTAIKAPVARVWDAYNSPADIMQWNQASHDWHTPRATVDLRVGGKFLSRMEARDGSAGFDFEGTYTRVDPHRAISYRMADGRVADITFTGTGGATEVSVTFDAETENPVEMQRGGWQAILDSFGRHVESRL